MPAPSLYAGITTESSIGASAGPPAGPGGRGDAPRRARAPGATRHAGQRIRRRAYDTAVTGTDPRSGIGAPAAIVVGAGRGAARTWARGRRALAFIPPWRASVLDDMALNRPLNLLFRLLRAPGARSGRGRRSARSASGAA